MQDSRAIVMDAINHRQPKRVPMDFGGSNCSGIHCSVVAELRKHYGLKPGLVKIHEPYQMLGYIDEDLRDAMGVDAVPCLPTANMFGVPMEDKWKAWRTLWGQDVLIPEKMIVDVTPGGEAVTYPQGDKSAGPSARMPASGYFFDAIVRQGPIDEDDPDPRDNTEEFVPVTDAELAIMARNAKDARRDNRAVVAGLPGTAFGDIAMVPGMFLKKPKGIRDIAEWYMSLAARPEFVHAIFDRQLEVAIENMKRVLKAVGPDGYDVVFVCGTDFGTQIGTFCSQESFLDLFAPYYKKINAWIHENTKWKTWKHSCGAIENFIGSLIDCGFDVLNPVQCSATGMDPAHLKKKYGDRITFWGAGIDTQKVLPFGTPQEVKAQVLERLRIFSPGGGFIFNAIHNVQAKTPLANMVALLDSVKEFNQAGK